MTTDLPDAERLAAEWACSRLVHLYANLNDAADWQGVADLYVAAGRSVRPTAPDRPVCGRDAILAAFLARPPRATRHVCANVVIDVIDRDTAEGQSAMLLFTSPAPPVVGGFRDRFVRTDRGWRFAERRGWVDFAP